jgi:serine/threonine-protein kinase HipA
MARTVEVYMFEVLAGVLTEKNSHFSFVYDDDYQGKPLSISLPTTQKLHTSESLHPFFESLAPEGWLRQRYADLQQIDEQDSFGFLIENGKDTLGAVTLKRVSHE